MVSETETKTLQLRNVDLLWKKENWIHYFRSMEIWKRILLPTGTRFQVQFRDESYSGTSETC